MGLITGLLNVVFGSGRNIIKETAEVFRANAEEDAERGQEVRLKVLEQYAKEFDARDKGLFDRIMDGVNRVPRPALALGTLGLFVAAMVDPIWFAARMQGIALVPEPLWWLLGVVVSFYFGARHQIKSQQFQRSIAQTMAAAPQVAANISTLRALTPATPGAADSGHDARLRHTSLQPDANPALVDWQRRIAQPATK
jgi:hypothetical protein